MTKSTNIFCICLIAMFFGWTLWCVLMVLVGEPFSSPYLRASARILIVLIPAIVYFRLFRKSESDYWLFRNNLREGLFKGGLLSGILGCLILVQNHGQQLELPTDLSVWINFIIFSPLVEELMFRRVVLEHLKLMTTVTRAIIFSAILFSLFHLPWWLLAGEKNAVMIVKDMSSLFVYGVVFSLAVHKTKSIWSSVIPHWINNLLLLSFNS